MFGNSASLAGPSLPLWFLLPATIFFALLAWFVALKVRGTAARYLIFTCWLRYTLSSLHEFTYTEAFPGVRWIAIGSLFSIGLGLLLLDKRRLFSKPLVPVWIICAIMLVSATVNGTIGDTLEPILRFLFFAVIAVSTWEALETSGPKVVKQMLFLFLQPITYQIASIALGVIKSGEIDGSVSYIGGFYHEELFSVILATCFLIAVFAARVRWPIRVAFCVISFVGVYLANYRTTMLGIAPLGLAALLLLVPRAFHVRQRGLVRGTMAVFAMVLILVGFSSGSERFADLRALTDLNSLIKPPATFTFEEQRVLSARPYIWSNYLYAYADAPTTQKLIGHGPDAWVDTFTIYAHNTLISFLYELGLAGVAAILLLWISMFRIALRTQGKNRGLLIAAHASFFVLNMGTMPHWQVEGNIFYGLLCGYTIAKARVAIALGGTRPTAVRQPPPPRGPREAGPIWPAEPESPPNTARRRLAANRPPLAPYPPQ